MLGGRLCEFAPQRRRIVTNHEPEARAMPQTERQPARAYRVRMQSMGLRPVQIWVPDTTRPGFAGEASRQVALFRDQPEHAEALEFIAAAQDTRGWE